MLRINRRKYGTRRDRATLPIGNNNGRACDGGWRKGELAAERFQAEFDHTNALARVT